MSNPLARRRVACLQDVPDGECIAVELEDREIALYRVDSQVFATDNICTHGAARLCDGFLDGYAIECPMHQGAFDIRSGTVLREPAEDPLATYAVEVDEQGEIYIELPA
ncbi:non-heme iron oxygenase ferredoxin subunit [Steroidobacter sp.]|uniref:non-heme iron oxygenase ferredoxin subunit n=1 Tax=Steroidobacter sp. TaxID=1978227 RepID=UPI0025E787A0|nr:non-heme iron oxygenase ferredoxin subunit [Steroidobacter sp.]